MGSFLISKLLNMTKSDEKCIHIPEPTIPTWIYPKYTSKYTNYLGAKKRELARFLDSLFGILRNQFATAPLRGIALHALLAQAVHTAVYIVGMYWEPC